MFFINISVLKENFVKYYGGETSGLICFKNCFGILLYGMGLENSNIPVGSVSVSVGTYVIVRIKENNSFKIVLSDTDTQFECPVEKLRDFNGDKMSKALFRSCAMLRGEIKGGEIFIDYSADDKRFKRPVTALSTALGIINKGKMPEFEAMKFLIEDSDEEKYSVLFAELYGRKNTIINKSDDGKFEYLPFNLSGVKAVISYVENKAVDISKELSDEDMEKYKSNESKRVEIIKTELLKNKTITQKISKTFKTSAFELFRMLGKSTDFIADMYRISEETGHIKAVVPVFSIGGICAFVEDKDTDQYVEKLSLEYQKKAGRMPAFCICDSDSGAIISDIESK